MLVGREDECALIDRLLERTRGGRSSALVLRGEAGIGKSTLLEYAADRARGMTVVRTVGLESDAALQFSALLDVCRPLLDKLGDLPKPQAAALSGALGLGPPEAADRFAVGAATLSLLAAAADETPLLVLVDDAHWLDRSSREALVFAVRRLRADPVAVLFAARVEEGQEFEPRGVQAVHVGGLTREAAAALLAAASAKPPSPDVAERLHAATGGNPLALVELPSLLTPEQLTGAAPLVDPLPVGPALEGAFAGRAAALREDARRALLLAAVSASTDIEPVVSALAIDGLDASALEPTEDAGLVRLEDSRIVFRHPLVRSVVFHAAAPSERRAAHRSLAEALAGRGWRPGSAPSTEAETRKRRLRSNAQRG